MDREALDHSLVRRLVDHIDNGTTDLTDEVMEVPADVYTSADHLRRELDAIFYAEPLVLCLSGALPGPGAYKTVDMCGTPVLVTRDADGKVHAMANACRHRGVRVVDGSGTARRFTCPFHAWVYDTDRPARRAAHRGGLRGHVPRGQGTRPAAGGRGLRPRRRPPAARPAHRHRRVPRARAGPRAGAARLRRLGALRRDPHAPGRGELEGHARHVSRELPLRLPAPRHAQVLRLRRRAHVRRHGPAPAELLGAALDRRAAGAARGRVAATSTGTSATSTRCSPTRA